MPVSLERLIAEQEAGVVTYELLRDCIVVGRWLRRRHALASPRNCCR
jgi:hypothetical protein